jgi:hypothetical protein
MKSYILFLVGAIAMSSCAEDQPATPAEAASISVTGQQLVDFDHSFGVVGGMSTIYGRPLVDGKPTLQNVLYLMIIFPGGRAATNHSCTSGLRPAESSSVECYYDWATITGSAHLSLLLNTRSGAITIGSQGFERKNGNVFVVVSKSNGELTSQQCGTLGPLAKVSEVVRHIRQQLPKDKLVASVRVPEFK